MSSVRFQHFAILAALLVALAVALPGSASAAPCTSSTPTSNTFFDSASDSEYGLAPELTALRVSLDGACNVKFAYDVTGQAGLIAGEFYYWFIDTDNNSATGAGGGFPGADVAVGLLDDGFAALSAWNGSQFAGGVQLARTETFGASARLSQLGANSGVPIRTAGGGSWTASNSGNKYDDWVPDGYNEWLSITPFFTATSGGGTGGGGGTVGGNGADRCIVPGVRGLTLSSAKRKIRNANCRVGSIRKRTNNQYAGRALGTSPGKGSNRAAGTKVTIYVGKRSKKRGRSAATGSVDLVVARLRAITDGR